ncbi:hypothetical protein [Texcoconibacillus texcoconensis]|uniref:Uncharacterized protein n=1 Tax=Texcoconibacillus texcoconensis TaxID=1095777 RepID=A0A840QPT7_9BACI|nr:hypothetical protein [Texcoconibacillus texcoconensis]MBB5173380.1 hypothetical protein [Texcoconibacillus texcoconensis]
MNVRAEELAEQWVQEQLHQGKGKDELDATMFIYDDTVLEVTCDRGDQLNVSAKEANNVIVLRTPAEEKELGPICRACGMTYEDEKSAIQCCADID